VATVLGLLLALAGLAGLVAVFVAYLKNVGPPDGFGLILAALFVFSGTQLLLLGLIGEYIGRMFLTISQRPQAVVRDVVSNHANV